MNIPIAWHHYGSTAERAPALLMLHGFMGAGTDWSPIANLLGRTCLCPDLPGHGDVRNLLDGADSTMAALAEALVKGLKEYQIGRCALAGYSMGGRLALYLAVHYSEYFTCLTLESASPGIADLQAREVRKQEDNALAERLAALQPSIEKGNSESNLSSNWNTVFSAFLREWYGRPLFHTLQDRPDLLESLIARRMRNNPRALAAPLSGMGAGAQPNLWKYLPDLKMPVLLITGAEDEKFTGIADSMKAILPRVEHHPLPKCSHCPHEEEPELFADLLAAFLRNR